MEAVKTFDIATLLVFLAGACIGITTFSRVLSYALKNFRNITLAVLTGFMLGSLNKVWPWKETLETFTDSHGVVKPLVEANILPNQYIVEAVVLMIVGFFLVYFLESFLHVALNKDTLLQYKKTESKAISFTLCFFYCNAFMIFCI